MGSAQPNARTGLIAFGSNKVKQKMFAGSLLGLLISCFVSGPLLAQGFREAPRAPAAGSIAPIQAPNSGPRVLEAQSAGASANQASTAQSASGAVKAPSSDMSVEDMIKALSGGTSQPGSPSTVTNAQSLNKASPGGPNSPAAATGSIQDPAKQLQSPPGLNNAGAMVDLTIQFAFDSATILEESKGLLERLAKALNAPQLQSLRFVVEGHTDGVGNKTYNDQLSARRAQSVVDFLVTQGVSVNRLRSTGKGFAELLYPQDPKAAANRRVRIKVGV
jgi:OOP family OmpA-OmpF porin